MKQFFLSCLVILLLGSCTRDSLIPDSINNCDEGVIYFEKDLLPVIVSNCATAGCHAEKDPEKGIRLNTIANILKSVEPGNPEGSDLYKDLAGVIPANDKDAMPPPPLNPLTNDVIKDIYDWIKGGAQLYVCDVDCIVESTNYSKDVSGMMTKYCVGCHNQGNASGSVILTDYDSVKKYADNGQLMGTIKHENGYSIMPPDGNKVESCDILKLQDWIDSGALDN